MAEIFILALSTIYGDIYSDRCLRMYASAEYSCSDVKDIDMAFSRYVE